MDAEGFAGLWGIAIIGGPIVLGIALAYALWMRRRARKSGGQIVRSK